MILFHNILKISFCFRCFLKYPRNNLTKDFVGEMYSFSLNDDTNMDCLVFNRYQNIDFSKLCVIDLSLNKDIGEKVLLRIKVAYSLYKWTHAFDYLQCNKHFVIWNSIVHLVLHEFMHVMNDIFRNQIKWAQRNNLSHVMEGLKSC